MNYRGLPFAFGTKLTWQWLLLTGKQRFCVTAFLKVASGKFPWIRKKEQKNYSWHFPRYVLLNPKRLNQSRQSEMYQTVEIRCCLRAVFVFGAKSHATLDSKGAFHSTKTLENQETGANSGEISRKCFQKFWKLLNFRNANHLSTENFRNSGSN